MNLRTDIAHERQEILSEKNIDGVVVSHWTDEETEITLTEIKTDEAEKIMSKPKGKYVTLKMPEFSHESELTDGRLNVLTKQIRKLLPSSAKTFLVLIKPLIRLVIFLRINLEEYLGIHILYIYLDFPDFLSFL